MKNIGINQMENITGGSFWGTFCGTTTLAWGLGSLAVELAIVATIPGLNIIAGVAAVGCAIAVLSSQ